MKFYAKPFIYITPLFALGVLLGDLYDISEGMSWLLIAILIASIALLLLKRSLNPVFPVAIVVGMIFLGSNSVDFYRYKDRAIGNGDKNGEASMLLNVLEVDNSESLWSRMVCETVAILGEDSYVPHKEKILIYSNASAIRAYDQILFHGSIKLIENKHNPGEFDARHYWNSKNMYSIAFMDESQYLHLGHSQPSWYDNIRTLIGEKLDEVLGNNLESSNLAVAKALILGDKSLLRPETKKSFSSAGAMHVLAVSGLHVGIILEILLFLLGRFPQIIKKNLAIVIALIILWVYAAIVGFSPSVVRATIMFTLLALGRMYSRKTNGLNILLFSACLMLFYNPLLIYDIGFQLSYMAMIGILVLYKSIESAFYIKNKWIRKVWQGSAVGLSAQLFTLPLTLYYFHQFPNYFLLTNVGMMVFAGLILSVGLFLFATNWISIVGKLVGLFLGVALTAMILFVEAIENLSGSVALGFTLPGYFVGLAYFILLLLITIKAKRLLLKVVYVLSIALLVAVQIIRYQNIISSEMVIFNSSELCITIKEGNSITCLHTAENGKTDGLDFMTGAYAKVKPGKVRYVKLGRGETKVDLKGGSIKLVKFDNGYQITVGPRDESFFLRTGISPVPFDASEVIDMPYAPVGAVKHNLSTGCYRLKLNE
jgi:competence protein ComEC